MKRNLKLKKRKEKKEGQCNIYRSTTEQSEGKGKKRLSEYWAAKDKWQSNTAAIQVSSSSTNWPSSPLSDEEKMNCHRIKS